MIKANSNICFRNVESKQDILDLNLSWKVNVLTTEPLASTSHDDVIKECQQFAILGQNMIKWQLV